MNKARDAVWDDIAEFMQQLAKPERRLLNKAQEMKRNEAQWSATCPHAYVCSWL